MAVRASLHGLLNLTSAHRLLDAADRGAPEQVEQVRHPGGLQRARTRGRAVSVTPTP